MKKWIALALVFAGVASQSASAQGFSFYSSNRAGDSVSPSIMAGGVTTAGTAVTTTVVTMPTV